MERQELIQGLGRRITSLVRPHPVRVAIDGVDAAGKTTLADELAAYIERAGRPVIRASVDGFHNPAVVRRRRAAESPEGYFHDFRLDWQVVRPHRLPMSILPLHEFRVRVCPGRAFSAALGPHVLPGEDKANQIRLVQPQRNLLATRSIHCL